MLDLISLFQKSLKHNMSLLSIVCFCANCSVSFSQTWDLDSAFAYASDRVPLAMIDRHITDKSELVLYDNEWYFYYDSLYSELIKQNLEGIHIRRTESSSIDVFLKNRLRANLDGSLRAVCGGLLQLVDMVCADGLIIELNNGKKERISGSYVSKGVRVEDRFLALLEELETDTSLIFDKAVSRRYSDVYRTFSDASKSEASMTMKIHVWEYTKDNGARMRCDCHTETCKKQEERLNEILSDICDSLDIKRVNFLCFNYRERSYNDFEDYYISCFPKLQLPCIIAEGKVATQFCMDGDTARCSSRGYSPEVNVGAFQIDGHYITLKKKSSERTYKLETFDKRGNLISSLVFSEANSRPNVIIMGSGRIIDVNAHLSYIVCPNGEITPYNDEKVYY